MKISQALRNLLLIVPFVLGEKGSMDNNGNGNGNGNGNNVERELLSSSNDERYPYSRNYLTVIETDNFVSLFGNGGGLNTVIEFLANNLKTPPILGSSVVYFGNVFEPADIQIVNKLNGVEESDPGVNQFNNINNVGQTSPFSDNPFFGAQYAGNRQPKSPMPPGDPAFFFHGECVATSASFLDSDVNDLLKGGLTSDNTPLETYARSFQQTSHTCTLNLCLGGGGFNCIAIYAGSSFIFSLGKQFDLGLDKYGNDTLKGSVSLPPPFPATIIGGTGSFEGIEGTVDIATICGTAGAVLNLMLSSKRERNLENDNDNENNKNSERERELTTPDATVLGPIKVGYIVQTIKVKSNMPLPIAP